MLSIKVCEASCNSLSPGRSEWDSKYWTFNIVLLIGIFRSSHDNALRWMPQDLTDDKSTLVQVMAWCRQATSHYLSQCWLSPLSPCGVTRPQWVKLIHIYAEMCSERDSPLKRLYRRTHAKLTRLAGSGQLVWAAGCELSLALVHARRPAWPGKTSETILRVAPPRKTRPLDHTRVNWPVDASA